MGEDRENGVPGQWGAGGVQKAGEERVGHESSKRGGSGRNYSIIAIKKGLTREAKKKGLGAVNVGYWGQKVWTLLNSPQPTHQGRMEDVQASDHIAPESVNSEQKGNSSLILIIKENSVCTTPKVLTHSINVELVFKLSVFQSFSSVIFSEVINSVVSIKSPEMLFLLIKA